MSIIHPELEIVDRSTQSVRYLEHGWPTSLCRWHAHEEFELHLITQTKGKVFVGDYIGTFDPGNLFLIGPLLPHNWVTDESQHHPVALRDMLIQFDHTGLASAQEIYPEFRELIDLLQLASSGIQFIGYDPQDAQNRMVALRECKGFKQILLCFEFLHVLSQWPDKKALSLARVTNKISKTSVRNYRKIAEIIEFVVANYTARIPLKKVASMSGMSESAFSRYFQETTGNRFSEFLNRVRIGQACRRLYETNDQIASICYEVGFRNIANFNRQFAKIKGITPKVYRRQAQENLIHTVDQKPL